jgi:hypothetical protein
MVLGDNPLTNAEKGHQMTAIEFTIGSKVYHIVHGTGTVVGNQLETDDLLVVEWDNGNITKVKTYEVKNDPIDLRPEYNDLHTKILLATMALKTARQGAKNLGIRLIDSSNTIKIDPATDEQFIKDLKELYLEIKGAYEEGYNSQEIK